MKRFAYLLWLLPLGACQNEKATDPRPTMDTVVPIAMPNPPVGCKCTVPVVPTPDASAAARSGALPR